MGTTHSVLSLPTPHLLLGFYLEALQLRIAAHNKRKKKEFDSTQ